MLNLKNKIGLLLILLTINLSVANASTRDFIGSWCWKKNNQINAFTLIINKIADVYKGGYFSVSQKGNRIDDNEDAFTFKSSDMSVIKIKFKAGISGETGIAQLKLMKNGEIEWIVLQSPRGEFYAPKNAVLHKCQNI